MIITTKATLCGELETFLAIFGESTAFAKKRLLPEYDKGRKG